MIKDKSITWKKMAADSKALANKLKVVHESRPFTRVIGIARGGSIPAVLVARHLGIEDVVFITIKSYSDRERGQAITYTHELINQPGDLIIDDLVDEGDTMNMARSCFPNSIRAVLYAKPGGASLVHYCAAEVPQDQWLVFPWEEK